MNRAILSGGVVASFLLITACGSSSSAPATGDASPGTPSPSTAPSPTAATGPVTALTLVAKDFSFDPAALQVPAGASVTLTFQNQGKAEHSFTPLDHLAVDAEAEGGKSSMTSFHVPASGVINFQCKYHPTQMKGTITIAGVAASAPDAGTAPPPPPTLPFAPATPSMNHMHQGRGY